jgi:hypothetical protein
MQLSILNKITYRKTPTSVTFGQYSGKQKAEEAVDDASILVNDVLSAEKQKPEKFRQFDENHNFDQSQDLKHNQARCGFATGTEE